MIEIYNYYPNNFESVKGQKDNWIEDYINNHPHRLEILKYTGTVNYEFDSRIKDNTYVASHVVVDMDLSLMDHWTRVYFEELPVIQRRIPNQGEFTCWHQLRYFWSMATENGDAHDQVKIGEKITKTYDRDNFGDPWTENSSTTLDIMMSYRAVAGFGGAPLSGGRGADNQANSCQIRTAWLEEGIGIFIPYREGTIFRLPWEDPWDNESDVFTDSLADYIAAGNAVNPGCWSGSTTMALEFS